MNIPACTGKLFYITVALDWTRNGYQPERGFDKKEAIGGLGFGSPGVQEE
jgi:hypothetical protein